MNDRCLMTFDPGRRTAWALWRPGMEKPRANVIDMPETDKIGVWSLAFREYVLPFMRLEGVTNVASEAPIIPVFRKKPKPGEPESTAKGRVDINVAIFHIGILVTIEQVCAELGLPPVVRANRSSVTLHFTGSGKGKREELKRRCLVSCQAHGWNVTDEDKADAIAVLDWFCYEQDQSTPWDCAPRKGMLFSGADARSQNKAEDRAVNSLAQKAMRFNDRSAS